MSLPRTCEGARLAEAARASRQGGVVSRAQLIALGLAPTDIAYRMKIGRLRLILDVLPRAVAGLLVVVIDGSSPLLLLGEVHVEVVVEIEIEIVYWNFEVGRCVIGVK